MARLVVHDLDKVYPGGVKAVEGFRLDVADGEFVALVGPSGCGKTKLLRLIAGLDSPTAGTIRLGERSLEGVLPRDRNVAMVFQSHALYPHLTVRGNLAFPLKLRGVDRSEIDRRVGQAAELLGIERLLERKPRQLSGGEQQRVALGRAMVRNPSCFLLDEPLSNLDARLRDEMRWELKRLHDRLRTTTLYVTHDQHEAMTLGERVVVMQQGRIQQVGPPQEVYDHPLNGFVAGFIGASPMSFLHGRLREDADRLWFEQSGQRLAVPPWAVGELCTRAGTPVVLGVRPQALGELPTKDQAGSELRAVVESAEFSGDHWSTILQSGGDQLACRFRRRMDGGAEVRLFVDLDRVHFFEPRAAAEDGPGRNLCWSAEPRGQ
jgi:multiple sugar transport system ATP-binding protein